MPPRGQQALEAVPKDRPPLERPTFGPVQPEAGTAFPRPSRCRSTRTRRNAATSALIAAADERIADMQIALDAAHDELDRLRAPVADPAAGAVADA